MATAGIFGDKNDILVETLRSIRSTLNIAVNNNGTSSSYSPKMCPTCCDYYTMFNVIVAARTHELSLDAGE
jgi:hypothetical protein